MFVHVESGPAGRGPFDRNGLSKTVVELFRHRSPEQLELIEHDVARVLALQIMNPQQMFSSLRPSKKMEEYVTNLAQEIRGGNHELSEYYRDYSSLDDISRDLFLKKVAGPGNFYSSTSSWLAKGVDSNHPFQLILPGGNRHRLNSHLEDKDEAGSRKLTEEAHMFGTHPKLMRPLSYREYGFNHDKHPMGPKRIFSREDILRSEIHHGMVPTTYDPKDKASVILQLAPAQMETLFAHEEDGIMVYGQDGSAQRYYLVDSLCKSPARKEKAHIIQVGFVDDTRDALLLEAYRYDLKRKRDIINKLLLLDDNKTRANMRKKSWKHSVQPQNIDMMSNDELKAATHKINEFLINFEERMPIDDKPLDPNIKIKYPDYLSDERIARREKLLGELDSAAKRVMFERSLPFIQYSGPQKPFLLAQLLLRFDITSPSELRHIQESPEIYHIFATACDTFGIDMKSGIWYEELMKNLKQYRDNKVYSLSHADILDDPRVIAYEEIQAKLTASFCRAIIDPTSDKVDKIIKDPFELARKPDTDVPRWQIPAESLTTLRNGVDQFLKEYLGKPLEKVTSKDVLEQLRGLNIESSALSFDELFLHLFGLSSTRKEALTFEQKFEAWRSLLLVIKLHEADKLWHTNAGRNNDASDKVFYDLVTDERKKEALIEGEEYFAKPFTLADPIEPQIPFDREVQIPGIEKVSFATIPVNILVTTRRKQVDSILRKLLERGHEDEQITDFYGRAIVIDAESFWQDFTKKYPEFEEYKKEIVKAWQREVTRTLLARYEATFKDSGYSGYELSKVKQWGVLADIIPSETPYKGSHASRTDLFSWCKYVYQTYSADSQLNQEEIQIFPSRADAEAKLKDSWARYDVERLFRAHEPLFYPLVYLLFGVQEEYGNVVTPSYTYSPN